MMNDTDVANLIADLNLAATLPPVGSPECARGMAALATVHAGTKLIEHPGASVVYLIEDGVMIQIAYVDGRYVASRYDEQVR